MKQNNTKCHFGIYPVFLYLLITKWKQGRIKKSFKPSKINPLSFMFKRDKARAVLNPSPAILDKENNT